MLRVSREAGLRVSEGVGNGRVNWEHKREGVEMKGKLEERKCG